MNTPPATTTKLIVADDHALARAGFSLLLEKIHGVSVIAQAANGKELVDLTRALKPDVVLTDIQMPVMDGLDAIMQIRQSDPETQCVVVSMFDNGETVRKAAACGAAGYIMKNASALEFASALDSLRHRGTYFSPSVAALLLAKDENSPEALLTERQIAIVKLIASGLSTKEIAFELKLSTKTVDSHRGHILERLKFNDPASLTRYAIKHKLIKI